MKQRLKTVLVVVCSAACLFASDNRINALGGNPGLWADDDQNLYLFPQTINNLDMIQVNGAGNSDYSNVSVIWGEETTWGFTFDGNDQNGWVSGGWGNGSMGVLFGLGMSSDDPGGGADKASTMDLMAGWGQDMGFGELGVMFNQSSSDNGGGGDQPSSMNLGVNLRRGQSLWLFSDMLASFGFGSGSDASGVKSSGMGLGVNCFTTLGLSEGTRAVFSMGFGYSMNDPNTDADDDETTSITLPAVTLGVEADATDWATVRFGMNRSYYLSTTNGDAKASGAGDLNWSFGLGFDYGSFALDMVINENVFSNPVHYVTGRNTDPLATAGASLTYSF